MGVIGNSVAGSFLEIMPLNEIAKYPDGPPKNGVPFSGYPQQHPSEKNKLILVYDPLGKKPALLEFIMDDILYVEEIHSAVTESGEGVPLVKLWIRRGARGVLLEPFEVDDEIRFMEMSRELKSRFVKQQSAARESRSPGGPPR